VCVGVKTAEIGLAEVHQNPEGTFGIISLPEVVRIPTFAPEANARKPVMKPVLR
jgi:hypothetical protein